MFFIDNIESFTGLLNNAALMLILCVIYDTFNVYEIKQKSVKDLATGVLVGLTSIIVMLIPWSLKPGLFFDTRWVLLSLCGLFFGFFPTLIAVIIAGSFRLYQGGPGGIVGTVVIVVTACVGLIWNYQQQKSSKPLRWVQLYLFGLIVELAFLACMFLFPTDMRNSIIKAVAPPVLLVYPFLTLILGSILKRQEDRRSTEKELEEYRKVLFEEKERLAVTLRSIGDGVITTDTSGNVVLLNRIAENLTGWNKDEAVGKPLENIFHLINKRTREICENPVTKVLRCGQVIALANHTALIAKDGTELSIADSGAPIIDAQGKTIGVVLVFRDITEQIKTEKELLKVKKLESVGILAGGIAHDFNNILASILGNIEIALTAEDLNDATRDILSNAEKASLRAKDITQQLLTFSKGGEPIKKTSSLESVIKESAGFVLHGEKVVCQYQTPQNLWLADIDRGQISQVIQNIVINGCHAMPQGGVIEISCENLMSVDKHILPQGKEKRFVKISIKDNGTGIPPRLIDQIFDPYFSTKQEGSGLGLSITQSIIKKHNGNILVESSPGVGTTFSIYLPASDKTKPDDQTIVEANKASSQARILIMDDERMVRSVIEAMLVKLGHQVTPAVDGDEAIELYREAMKSGNTFDLVIMDLTIPGGMGGKEAAQKILSFSPEAKIIVASGYSNDPIMANFKDYGLCLAIAKPFQRQELSLAISQVLG